MAEAGVRRVEYKPIEGMRFYAAFLVFLVHMVGGFATDYLGIPAADLVMTSPSVLHSALAYASDGHHGVDVFFIISGFLMARIVLDSRGFGYGRFLWNRFRRIYPAFLASLVAMALVWVYFFGASFKPADFALNLVFANAIPEFPVLAYNYVSWSLGFEFAFYLVIPLLLVLSRFVDRRIAAALLLLAAFVLLPDSVIRMKGLFVGALIGSFGDHALRRAAGWLPLIPFACAYLLLVAMKGVGSLTYLQFYYAMLACLAVLFVRIVFGHGLLTSLFSHPVMARLGQLSYSFYLWHPLCVAMTLHYVLPATGVYPYPALATAMYAAVSLLLSIGVSALSYRLFERWYFDRRKHGEHAVPAAGAA